MTNLSPPAVARVLIVDDHPAVCEALANRIGRQPDLEVCGEAPSLEEAYRSLERESPDIAVVDLSLKGGSGLDLIKYIAANRPRTRTDRARRLRTSR
jgi:DNA-binding NarL/FixJ family response regulator